MQTQIKKISKYDKDPFLTDNERANAQYKRYRTIHTRQIQIKSNVSKIKLAKVPDPFADVCLYLGDTTTQKRRKKTAETNECDPICLR